MLHLAKPLQFPTFPKYQNSSSGTYTEMKSNAGLTKASKF